MKRWIRGKLTECFQKKEKTEFKFDDSEPDEMILDYHFPPKKVKVTLFFFGLGDPTRDDTLFWSTLD